MNEVSCVPLQQCLRHQQSAFKNFFEGRDGKLFLAKSSEPLNIRWSRALSSAPSTVTISRDAAGRYFVSCLCEFEPQALPVTPKMIGIDMGLKDLFVPSEGEPVANARHTAKYASRLALAQRSLSRKNRARARQKVARIHAKISDCRLDGLHKLSRRLINENQVVCVENLAVKNMIRNPRLSRAIADAGWGELVRQLEYKGA
ncbi:RNA-guided endonuclease InsQ/TnpB family protein, partial [Pseudomonas duriflava]|uniref:RNA-guided endonuclease InsQ/TnpB family protein n=1 Tax=Pseudomonas duriflava TaxID=459528 RepID=UPI001FCB0888